VIEYVITFNDEWVPDHTDEQLAGKSMAVRALIAEMKAAGVFVFTGGLDIGSPVFSVDAVSGEPVFTDGPFAESKELISYAVYDVRSRDEALEWATRFVRLHQEHWAGWEGEADVQQVFEAPPAP